MYGVLILHIIKKRMHLGRFKKIEDAIKVRKEAEEKYFGEFSYDKSMKGNKQDEN